jgi:XrtJ-associated TM-motif-TM protein
MKKSALLLSSAALLFVALPLHAQGGCVQSPENPTVILALVGSVGAFAVSARDRIKAYRNSKKK